MVTIPVHRYVELLKYELYFLKVQNAIDSRQHIEEIEKEILLLTT